MRRLLRLSRSLLPVAFTRHLRQVDEVVQKLLALKGQLKEMSGGDEEVRGKAVLKPPKGMRDFGPHQMEIRERALSQIVAVFKKHGAQAIDTPVCEKKEILTGKYGEDSKLIFDLQDQGGELLSLRYDLTVPFARYMAQNKLVRLKRYHIGKVYRRDNPAMDRGRFREFYQCDFDIAGQSDEMIADSECVRVTSEILQSLGLTDFVIKINHRAVIDGMFAVCGVPENLFRPICSAVDKLDKMSWPDVRKEMIEKGLSPDAADKIGQFVVHRGSVDVVDELLSGGELAANPQAKQGLRDVRLLFDLCQDMHVDGQLQFDMSLARGLDYYTGIIYEAVLTNSEVGSIAAGGRYDGLVSLLADTVNDKRKQVPCVGVSIGIERIFSILEKTSPDPKTLYPTHCYVASVGGAMVRERTKLLTLLWDAGLNAEQSYKKNPRILNQIQDCETWGIPVVLIIGENEVQSGTVKLKNVVSRVEVTVRREEVVDKVREVLKQVNKL